MDAIEKRAREVLAAEWKMQRDFGSPYSFATYMVEVVEKGEWDNAPDMRALVAALTQGEMLESQLKAAVDVAEIAQRRADRTALTPPEGEQLSESDKDVALAQAVEFADYVERQAKGAMVDAAKRFLSLPYAQELAKRLTPPEGYVLVPVKLTEKMLDALYSAEGDMSDDDMDDLWKQVLAARPEVPNVND